MTWTTCWPCAKRRRLPVRYRHHGQKNPQLEPLNPERRHERLQMHCENLPKNLLPAPVPTTKALPSIGQACLKTSRFALSSTIPSGSPFLEPRAENVHTGCVFRPRAHSSHACHPLSSTINLLRSNVLTGRQLFRNTLGIIGGDSSLELQTEEIRLQKGSLLRRLEIPESTTYEFPCETTP